MFALAGNGRHHRCRSRPRADHHDFPAREIKAFRPGLRMDNLSTEGVHTRPFRRVALGMLVIALAHPEEFCGEGQHFACVETLDLDGPALLRARPAGGRDLVAVADVRREIVLRDHLVHVFQDLFAAGDRRADPGLVAISESVEIGVRPDARIPVHVPGAAESFVGFQDDELLLRVLGLQVIASAHAGDTCADDQHIEMLRLCPGL